MNINPQQLILARVYRQYTQTSLAKNITGLSQSNLSKFEKGVDILSDDIVMRIVDFLGFPIDFFSKHISNFSENANYRKRASMTKSKRDKIDVTCKIIGYVIDQMSQDLEFPRFNLKMIDIEEGYTPIYCARYTRKILGIDSGAVKDINHILESNGIIVIEFDFDSEEFDGVSFISDGGFPIIIINKNFSNDRKRFSIAHELGHIIMHSDIRNLYPEHRNKEHEANMFASEFLMPEVHIKSDLRNLSIRNLIQLKQYWLTSMASIIRRAKDLGCISKERYSYLNIELSREGYKKREPADVYIDEPKIFTTSYSLYKDELHYSNNDLSQAFALPLDIIETLFYNNKSHKLRVII